MVDSAELERKFLIADGLAQKGDEQAKADASLMAAEIKRRRSSATEEAPKAPEATEESYSDKLNNFLGDISERGSSIADSVSDIGLPFTDKSVGEVAFGREPSGNRQIWPQEAGLQIAGSGIGGVMDTIGAGAELLTPDSWGVEAGFQKGVGEAINALNSTPAGAKALELAMSGVEGWQEFERTHPQLAKSIGSAANIASILTPSTGATKAGARVAGEALEAGGKNLAANAKTPFKEQIKKHMIGLDNLTGKGRSSRSWRYGKEEYNPVDYEEKMIDVLADIPGIKPTDPHRSLGLIDETLDKKYIELDKILKGSGDAIDVKTLNNALPIKIEKGKRMEYLNKFGDEGKNFATKEDIAMFRKVMADARAHLAKTDGSPAAINEARKNFANAYKVTWDQKGSAKDEAVKYASQVMNDAVDEMVPDAQTLRADQISPLMAAKDAVGRKAATTDPGRMQGLINRVKANPFTPTSILSMGALAGAAWAPWAAGGGLAAMGAFKGAKALKNNAGVRKALGTAVEATGKAIKKAEASGASKAVIDQMKADRLLLISMIDIPQEGDPETKKEP